MERTSHNFEILSFKLDIVKGGDFGVILLGKGVSMLLHGKKTACEGWVDKGWKVNSDCRSLPALHVIIVNKNSHLVQGAYVPK